MEDEILSFLKNPPVQIKPEQAEALCKVLREDQECTSMKDVVRLKEKDWEDVFKKVELKTAPKERLLEAIKNMITKPSIPIAIESKEVVLVSKIIKNTAYVTLKVQLYVDYKKKNGNNISAEIDLNNEKWKNLEIKEGDEIECCYSINEANTVTIQDITFPEMYSTKNGSKQCVYVYYKYFETMFTFCSIFKMLLGMVIKVVFWKAGATPTSEEEPRKDDIVQFRLRFLLFFEKILTNNCPFFLFEFGQTENANNPTFGKCNASTGSF
ncbi:hypothetical protein RFI_35194 [Reticulomyxa filosa]|uniref:Uncharacterized protein n=1 Tax=Reticulomyxa filosa TaxID=46433 RepID=X6LM63_RETFI|nr:hypothetical protein RFI_35194 [Reticulomyxa filosa]|eukprot:ETO02242.1 hypothetical protein RFI_35194 [Reticulomyxa filosa]